MPDITPNGSVLESDSRRYGLFFALVLLATIALSGIVVAITYVIDPYGEAADADGIYFESGPATIWRYRDLLADEPFVVTFGTSRSGLISDAVIGQKVLNFLALYGFPRPILSFLEGLDERHLRNIRRVVYLLDIHTFGRPPNSALSYPRNAFERFTYRIGHLREYVADSITRVVFLARGNYQFHVHPRGFSVQDRPASFDGVQIGLEKQSFDAAEIAHLAEIKSFCDRHGIPIEFITPVLPDSRLKIMNLDLLFAQRRAFARVLGQYFELTRIDGISDRPELFADDSHLNEDGMAALFALYPWKDRIATTETIDGFLSEMSNAAGP